MSGSALSGDLRSASWTSSGTSSTTSTARPRSPGWRSPAPEDLLDAPGTAGRPPRGTELKILGDDDRPVPRRRHRPDLRQELDALRGLHGRRREGHGRRDDVHGRRRPPRRRGAAVRRGPRRRHDRLGRRERVPAGGRGDARQAPEGGRGGGGRRRGREVGPGAEGVRGQEGRVEREGAQEARQGQPGRLQGAAGDRVPRRAAAQRGRQGAQARARGGGERAERYEIPPERLERWLERWAEQHGGIGARARPAPSA